METIIKYKKFKKIDSSGVIQENKIQFQKQTAMEIYLKLYIEN